MELKIESFSDGPALRESASDGSVFLFVIASRFASEVCYLKSKVMVASSIVWLPKFEGGSPGGTYSLSTGYSRHGLSQTQHGPPLGLW